MARGKEEEKLRCLQQCQGAATGTEVVQVTQAAALIVSQLASLDHFKRSRVGFRQLLPKLQGRVTACAATLTAVASSKWNGPKMSITLDTKVTISLLGRGMD